MRQLIFYKKFDNSFNKYQYIFKIINSPNKYNIKNLIYNFGIIPNEYHIIVLYNTITQLWITNMSNFKEFDKPELYDDLNEIHFMSDLNDNENFDIFINQIIEKTANYIDLDFR